MRTILITCVVLLCAASCYKPEARSYPLGHEKNPLIMAFVPSTEAEKVISSGESLAALLADETDLHFKPHLATSYVSIVEAMAVGKVHVAWLPPMAYVFAHERNGDEVVLKVVRHGSPTYRGQIVVRADGGIESIADLKGKRIAFADQTSASGHYYPAVLLKQQGIDPAADMEIMWAGSHDAALVALVKGSVDVACSYDDAREKLETAGFADIIESTRVLAYTADIPADNIAVIKELDSQLKYKITAGLLALAADEKGRQVLMDLYEIEGLVPAADADYDPVREMVAALDKDIEEEVRQGN